MKGRWAVVAAVLVPALLPALLPGGARAVEPQPVVPAPQPVAVTLATGVRASTGAAARACAGARRPCELTSLRGATFELSGAPGPALDGRSVLLRVSHRAPGARRLVPTVERLARLGADGDATIALTAVVGPASGTWCVTRELVAAPDLVLAGAAPTCVRYRPPIEIGWAGDIVVGSHYGLPPNGGRDQLARVAKLLRAPDLMIGNYEGTLSRGGSSRCSGGALCFIFQAPPERARNLRVAGFDVMNLANNHGLDKGVDARRQTVAALAQQGIAAAGLPGQVTVVRVQDTRVAIVGISPYAGTTSMRDPRAVRALVKAARRRGDVVVVAFHAGLEGARGAHVPRGADYGTFTRAALHTAVDAGADVVLGSGPHVVRGVERYRGTFIVYSSGNFAGWHNFALGGLSSQSGVVRVTFDAHGNVSGAAWDGVVIDAPGVPRPDRSGSVVRRVASLSRADFGRAGARFSRDGRFR